MSRLRSLCLILLTASLTWTGGQVTATCELRYRPVFRCGRGNDPALLRMSDRLPVRVVYCVGQSWDVVEGVYRGGDVVEINGREVRVEGGVCR